jgi:lysophospholipase L1-like esterase
LPLVLPLLAAWLLAGSPPAAWPLSPDERDQVLRPEHERRPGAAEGRYEPALWPVTPTAGHWGGAKWLEAHGRLVEHVGERRGPVDILLVGDSIIQQWGSVLDRRPLNAAWQGRFGRYQTVNLGLAGDKTQNVLWRLAHGGVEGLRPRVVLLLIGNNNMYFTRETGVAAAAGGVRACVDQLRARFPEAGLVVVTILPAHAPGHAFYEDIRSTNAALWAMRLEADPHVHLLDLWPDLTEADGTLKRGLFQPDNIHLTRGDGYELFATRLQPLLARLLP